MKVAIKYGLNGPNVDFSFIINRHKNLHQELLLKFEVQE